LQAWVEREPGSGTKRNKEFHLSDQLGDASKVKYGGCKSERQKARMVDQYHQQLIPHYDNNSIDVHLPSPIAPKDDPAHLMEEESKTFIQKRLTDHVVARKSKEYAMADMTRFETSS
jgi:hypothetical protein